MPIEVLQYGVKVRDPTTKQFSDLAALRGGQGAQGATGPGVPAGGTAGQVPVKASAADYDLTWTTAALHISVASFSSLPQTISNSAITAKMRVVNCVWGTPSAITGSVTWETAAGSLTLSGSISGSTTAEIDLICF